MAINQKMITKSDGTKQEFQREKIEKAIHAAFLACAYPDNKVSRKRSKKLASYISDTAESVEDIQDAVETILMREHYYDVAKAYILYRAEHKKIRDFAKEKITYINNFKTSSNTANVTVDDNSNVASKNIGVLNAEIHKSDNIQISRNMIMGKLKELYPEFDYKQYIKDLNNHIIYKHDESSFAGAIAPYCCAISMYPFLNGGIKSIGGLSAAPKNIDSFCGMYINLIFATSAQFAGAVATPEFLLYLDYFCKKEWGNSYYLKPDIVISSNYSYRTKTIRSQIHQYLQQVIYSINQPAAARGLQSAFVNWSLFDKTFYEGMFEDFVFPDGTKPTWESLSWLQKEFMSWFNAERLKNILTFPVVSWAIVYKNNTFADSDTADYIAKELSEGNSFFVYISDTVDSLSSCCFSKDTKVLWKSSTEGVNLTTLEELHNLKLEPYKKNLKIFHNGSWVRGKSVKLDNRKMYKVTTYNNKEFYMTDNHINVTYEGEKPTINLTTNDYLMFNTTALQSISENDEHLTYSEGILLGAFLGDGTINNYIFQDRSIHDMMYSLNESKYKVLSKHLDAIKEKYNLHYSLGTIYNNVYPVRVYSKEFVTFIIRWSNWVEHTTAITKDLNLNVLLQSYEFRKGILDGWYITDGGNSNRCYTVSPKLKDAMEALITSLGLQSIIDISDRIDEAVAIRGESFNRNYPLYCVRWYTPANHITNKDAEHTWKKKNNSIFFKVKSIEEVEYSDSVYCIECNNIEEPYFTLPNGLITHNCRLKNKVQTKEFSFTNGNIGIQTGSKSVITLNINRIIQDFFKRTIHSGDYSSKECELLWKDDRCKEGFKEYLIKILERVYRYHTAYNELLWDMYNANLLPVYKAGFINLNKQYLTIGINGLNQAAEFLGLTCSDNDAYMEFCQFIFSTIKEQNTLHKTKRTTYNTEQVPAESLSHKNYNWDKEDGYYVSPDINLYTSYIFKPYDSSVGVLEKLTLHGSNYIGDYLDGGAAAHINLDAHPTKEQCKQLLNHAAKTGCQYWTINVPNSECRDCGFIAKQPFDKCPKCGSSNIDYWDRVIGYLSKISNWSTPRQIEQKKRIYEKL